MGEPANLNIIYFRHYSIAIFLGPIYYQRKECFSKFSIYNWSTKSRTKNLPYNFYHTFIMILFQKLSERLLIYKLITLIKTD